MQSIKEKSLHRVKEDREVMKWWWWWWGWRRGESKGGRKGREIYFSAPFRAMQHLIDCKLQRKNGVNIKDIAISV